MSPEFWVGLAIGIGAWTLNAIIRKDAPQRHARYRLRAKLAQWVMAGKLQPVRAKKGKLVAPVSLRKRVARRQTERAEILSVVRRDDQAS